MSSISVNIDIYTRDTLPIILKRISSKTVSLPKYIKIISPDPVDFRARKGVDFTIIDLLHKIKTSRNFKEFYTEDIKAISKELSLIKDIVRPYIFLKVQPIPGLEDQIDLLVLNETANINKIIPNITVNFENYITERNIFLSELERDINLNKAHALEYIKNLEKQKEIIGKEKTPFELEKIKYIVTTAIENISIYEAFDALTLTTKFPLAYITNEYYKILKDFIIPEEKWIELKLENTIILKVVFSKSENFDIYFFIEENKLKFGFDIKTTQNIDIKIFSREIADLLNTTILEEKEIGINGVYFIPNQSINKYVFSHLVLNDTRFSHILFIDESARATKTKEGINVIYYNGIDEVSFVLSDKLVDIYDPDVRDKSRETFPEGSSYVRVKISRAKNIELVVEFAEIFSKLLTLYSESYSDVVKLYKKYIPNFLEKDKKIKKPVEAKKKRFLKDIVPDMFTAEYRRSCGHPPRIIDKEEAETLEDVMFYPKTPEEGKQHYYTCDNPKYKYIGLIDNKDPNITKYKFVPCCYPLDQKIQGAFTNYNEYYHGTVVDKTAGRQQKFIKTNKILGYEIYGSLEPFSNINMFFDGINRDDENYHYIRFGVDRSKYSFVQCVFEAMGKGYNNDNRLDDIQIEVGKIADDIALLTCGRQEIPDKNTEAIREMLLDKDAYIDPKLFIHILEIFYGCKIYLFSSETLEIPNHFKNYILNENNKPVVIIIEHIGSSSDKATYPQCELIIKANKFVSSDLIYNFDFTSTEAENLKKIFDKLNNSYYLSKNVNYCKIEKEILNIAKGQIIDTYGKTSAIIVNDDNKKQFCIYTKEPIQPLRMNENAEFSFPEIGDILKFLKETFIVDIKKVVNELNDINVLIIKTNLDNVYYIPVVPVKDDKKKFNFALSDERITIPFYKNASGLEVYNKNKKLSRYLFETFLYRFSKFIKEEGLDINESRNIVRFVEKKILVENKNVNYGLIPKNFDVDNVGLIKNGKIVLTNREVLKRLVYSLRLELSINTEKVKEYYKKRNIENYIKDLSDFRVVKTQIILFGEKAINSYIRDKLETYEMKHKIQIQIDKPFFFKNYLLGENNVYIAFNFKEKLDEAKEFIIRHSGQYSYGLFNYINSETINFIDGERDVSCILILKENEETSPKYFALIKV